MIVAPRSPLLLVLLAVGAQAGPSLEPQSAQGITVGLPAGWHASSKPGTPTTFVAQEDASRPNAAAVFITVQLSGNSASEEQLLERIRQRTAGNGRVLKREAVPGGGQVLVAEGSTGALKVRVGAVAMARGDFAVTCALLAQPSDFERVGGLGLLTTMLGSLKLPQVPAHAPPSPPPAQPGRITLPELAGTWDTDEASVKQYATSSGRYAGAAVVSIRKTYVVAPDGSFTGKFAGYSGGTAAGGGGFAWQDTSGRWSFTPNGVLEIVSKGNLTGYYTVVSYTTEGGLSTLLLAGPQYEKSAPPDPRCPCEKLFRRKPND